MSTPSQDYAYQRHAIESVTRGRRELVHLWYADVATGSTMRRPHLQKLRDAIRGGKVQRVWVWRLDRLTRSGIVDAVSCIDEMKAHGCELVSVADGFDLQGPAAPVIVSVLAWAAQQQRQTILENLAAARARVEAEGGHWGKPPVPDAVRELVRELGAMGVSVRSIARQTNISKSSAWNILQEGLMPDPPVLNVRPVQKTSSGLVA